MKSHAVPNSTRLPAEGAVAIGAAEPGAKMTVSLRLRRRAGAPPMPGAMAGVPAKSRHYLSREEYEQQYGAATADFAAVKTFAAKHGLTLTESDAGRRTAVLAGTVAQMNAAFAVELQQFHTGTVSYRGHTGPASVPAELADIVESVHGLDTRPLAEPLNRPAVSGQATSPLLPAQVAKLFGFPGNSAAGQTIGILEFGGGYRATDIQNYFQNIAHLGVPSVSFVGIDGATNSPGASADTEVILDIAVAGSVAPGAKLVVYFAPNTDQGWMDAITTAIHDKTNKPTALSISWGGGESGWGSQVNPMSAAFAEAAPLGISIFASSGDGGSGSPAQVLYPASDPNLTGCGGTTISNVSGTTFTQTAWSGSGGGVSNAFARPSWQSWANVPASVNPKGHVGRGVPDIAGNADPSSGYQLVLNGKPIGAWGGTSAVAPFYAGLVAVMNAALGAPLGFLNDNLYAFEGPYVFDDVTSGNNGSYTSAAGWDAVTGLGSINATAMQTALLGIGLPPALAVFNNTLFMAWKGIEFDERIFYTTYNGTAWAAQKQVPGVFTSAGVSLAVFQNQLYMAWKGEGNDQGIWWSVFNGSSWAAQKEVPNVATSTGPRLAVFQNKLYMTWKGMEDDQRLWWSSFNGSAWAAQKQIPNVASSVGPAIAVYGNLLYAAWKGEFGDQAQYYSTFNGTSWAPQKLIPGTFSTEGPSLAVYGNQLFATWKGEFADQRLWYASFNGTSWTPQKQIPGVFSSVGPGITVFGNHLLAAWKGMNGDERIWYTNFNGSAWAAQQIVPNVGTSPDLIVPAAAPNEHKVRAGKPGPARAAKSGAPAGSKHADAPSPRDRRG
jgi:kumamolisin